MTFHFNANRNQMRNPAGVLPPKKWAPSHPLTKGPMVRDSCNSITREIKKHKALNGIYWAAHGKLYSTLLVYFSCSFPFLKNDGSDLNDIMIHVAYSQSRVVIIISFTNSDPYVCPSVPTFKINTKQRSRWTRKIFASGGNSGLAKGIIKIIISWDCGVVVSHVYTYYIEVVQTL